jgi:hypothetical protein
MAYASEHEEEVALLRGYEVNRSADRGSSFRNGQRRIWSTRMGWQTADLIAGQYQNHQIFSELPDALERKL